ncbi:hypothetical protein O6H91_Y212000 [Diphasiastrum complanatum]|nr:hypothetical protein O6H91_Y212000 [Diphasiastrum complanatum]
MCKDEQQIGEEQVAEGVGSLIGGQDPGIKLFGRVISALNSSENDESGDLSGSENEEPMYPRTEFDHSSKEAVLAQQVDEDRVSTWVTDELGSSSGSYSGCEDEKTFGENSRQANPSCGSQGKPIVSGLGALELPAEIEREQHPATKSSEETTPRKPDKPVPCPRCDSLDTKFCYFNNYNVNQPRHFCKQCQRYWTAGGTLRNVPVGAGRRKHKHSSLQHQHQQQVPFDCFTVRRTEADSAQQLLPSSLPQMGHQSTQPFHPILPADRFLHSSPTATSTITTFKQDNPCPGNNNKSSSAFQLKSTDQAMTMGQAKEAGAGAYVDSVPKLQSMHSRSTISSEVSNGNMQEETARTAKQGKCAEECQSGSSLSAFSVLDRKEEEQLPMPMPIPSPTDPSGWQKPGVTEAAAGWVNAAAPYGFFNGAWPPPPYVFNPGWSAFPQSHVPASYYNPTAAAAAAAAAPPAQMLLGFPWCHPSMWAPGGWSAPPVWTPTMPWEAAAAAVAAAAAAAAASAISTGSSLGKHPRDRQMLPEGRIEGPLWLPKTLRMDDQGDQVRSSILASLGLSETSSQLNLPAKGMHKSFVSESAAASVEGRHDNPAATTRSVAFQESN